MRAFRPGSIVVKLASAAAVTTAISAVAAIAVPSAAGRSIDLTATRFYASTFDASNPAPKDFSGGILRPIPASTFFIAHHARGRRHVCSR